MTDQNRSKLGAYKSNCASISRRDVLRASATIIPASIIVPAWLTANAQTATTTFDYYISTTGSDSNPGTLSQPWSIKSLSGWTASQYAGSQFTAQSAANWAKLPGKRVGILPGVYDVSRLMYPAGIANGSAFQIPGGTSSAPSYWGSSDTNGQYSPRTATLDAKGASGYYGGNVGREGSAIIGVDAYPAGYTNGYFTIDGLRFTGFSYKGVRIGGSSSGDGITIVNPYTITNCEFFGGGWNSGNSLDNCAALWIDANFNAATVTNNWFHDTVGPGGGSSGDHLNAILLWGFGKTTYGSTLSYNTIKNAGTIYGKEGGVEGTTIQNNYIDTSAFTVSTGGIQDFTGNGQSVTGLSHLTTFQNNIIIMYGGGAGDYGAIGGISTYSGGGPNGTLAWMTPVIIRNNTIINKSGSGAQVGFLSAMASSAAIGAAQYYNNIYVNSGSGGTDGSIGNFHASPAALQVMDYNLYPASGTTWGLAPIGSLGSVTLYSSASAFALAVAAAGGISGVEAHGISGVPTFTGTGTYAAQYQLTSGSRGKGSGSTNGTSSGSPTDMGAWGNGATQIGCNFAAGAGAAIPNAPSLKVS